MEFVGHYHVGSRSILDFVGNIIARLKIKVIKDTFKLSREWDSYSKYEIMVDYKKVKSPTSLVKDWVFP